MNSCEGYQKEGTEPCLPSINGLADPEAAVYAAAAESLKPPPPADFIEWARENVFFDEDNPFPGPYNPDLFPFFKKVLKCLQPDHPARIVVLKGSAQCGKTVTAEVFVGASLDKDPGGIFYVHPSLDNAATWVRTKWKQFVNGSKALRRLFPREKNSRDSTSTLLHKERADGRGFLKVAGANSAASLAMQTYRKQVHDDLGKWDNNEHGDPENQADKRSQAWGDWAKLFKISTPGILGLCRITKQYERSNRQEYHVPCPHCGFRHALEWENFKKSLYVGMDYSEANFTCPSCGGVIEHHHKSGMLDATLSYDAWVKKDPDSKIEGFYIWAAYSRLVTWAYIAEEYFTALGNPEKEQTFITDVVGLAYEQKGEAPPWQDLYDRAKGSIYHEGLIPHGAVLLTMGMDVQGDRIEWLLKGWGSGLRRWTIQHGVIEGHITDKSTWVSLDSLLKRKWKNCFGREFQVDMVAIDANYERNDVKDWAKRHPESRVITVKGAREYTAPPLILVKDDRKNDGRVAARQKRHWIVGVSGLKASLYKQLEKTDPLERGYCGFPHDLDEEYFKQLTSEKRISETDRSGHTVMRWVKLPQVRNEILDMEVYAEAAARRLGWHNASAEEWERLYAARESAPPDRQLDLLDPNVIPKAGAGPKADSVVQPDSKKPPPAAPGRKVRNRGI